MIKVMANINPFHLKDIQAILLKVFFILLKTVMFKSIDLLLVKEIRLMKNIQSYIAKIGIGQ